MPKFLKPIDHNGQRDINIADGTAATDAVTLQQLQAAIRGLNWKDEARAASTGNITLATPGATIDGVAMAANDRVLLKNQTAAAENGIYVWNGASTLMVRAVDADVSSEILMATVFVMEGTTNADKMFTMNTDAPITLGTTSLTWAQFGGGSAYTAGSGLSLTANVFAVVAGTGIIADGTSTRIDTSIVARKFTASSLATTNPQAFAHGFGAIPTGWTITESGIQVFPEVTVDATNITIDWGAAPTAGQYVVRANG